MAKLKGDTPIEVAKNAVCTSATAEAIRVTMGGREFWIPQSAVHDDSEVWRRGDAGKLVVKKWLAVARGWA